MAKILLVEDDINLRDIYSARLLAEQHQVVTASDGEEALATAVREKPDLIILDVMMPKISGFDVLDILRSTPETKETKIIMMTALSQDTDKARGESLGVNKYLIKSQVTLEDVVATINEVLGGGTVTPSAPTTPVAPTPEPPAAPTF
jgi:DNA-binding response OmpR family regulator